MAETLPTFSCTPRAPRVAMPTPQRDLCAPVAAPRLRLIGGLQGDRAAWGYSVPQLLRVMAWARAHPGGVIELGGFFRELTGAQWRQWFKARLMLKINRTQGYGEGRKHDPDWQREMVRAARQLNTPRLVVRWLPRELRARFSERLEEAP